MIWTKLKQLSEELLAVSLQGRLAYHLTRYGQGLSGLMTRGWITLDGRELVNCSTIKEVRESHRLTGEWWSNDPAVRADLQRRGIFTREEFLGALAECTSQPVKTLLKSTNPLARAIVMFDRRLGKRRLLSMVIDPSELQIVKDFYQIRCQAEGIARPAEAA